MARLVLIDAWNALHRLWPEVTSDPDRAREHILQRTRLAIARRTVRGGAGRVRLIFDSRKGASRTGLRSRSGRIAWAYVEGSADEAIVALVREHGRLGGPRPLVVTDDRELAGRCRQLGASAVSVGRFYADAPDEEADPRPPRARLVDRRPLPPLTAEDFGLPEGEVDLRDLDGDAL